MTRVTGDLRRLIVARAGNCCEYCLLSQADHFNDSERVEERALLIEAGSYPCTI
jgi:hypothetical protein